MTMVLSEVNESFWDDTLLKNTPDTLTNEIIILGEDSYPLPTIHDPEFIGPHDATDLRRNFLETKARDLAKIAVTNFPVYEKYRAQAIAEVKDAISDGEIRLGAAFGRVAAEQAEQFVVTTMAQAYEPQEAVVNKLTAHTEQALQKITTPTVKLENDLIAAKEQIDLQGKRILQIRADLVDRGASEDFMRHYDYRMRLMTKPNQEAYELEMKLTPEADDAPLVNTGEVAIYDAFKELVKQISKKGLDLVGIHAPESAAQQIVQRS